MKLIEDKWSFQELFEDVYGEDDSDVCAPTPVCFKILWLWNQKPLFLVSSPKLLKQYRKSHWHNDLDFLGEDIQGYFKISSHLFREDVVWRNIFVMFI